MKNFFIITVLFVFISCKSDKIKDAIELNIRENALGIDVKPKFNKISIVDTVYTGEVIDEFYKINNDTKTLSNDSLKLAIIALANKLDSSDSDDESFIEYKKIWKWKANRIQYLESKKRTDVEYYIVNAEYLIKNELLGGTEVLVNNFYIIENSFKVKVYLSQDEFKSCEREFNDIKIRCYEAAIFSEDTGIEVF